MSTKRLFKLLQDEDTKKMTAGEFAKATRGLEWLERANKPLKVTIISNRSA